MKPSVSPNLKKTTYKINQKPESLDDMIKNIDAGFADTLFKIIDSKKLKDSEIYFKANMDRKLFSKIRNGSHPKKATAISLCIALELSLKETNDLLIKAGYILNNSEKFDVIITDGLENASKEYSSKEVKKMIKEQQDKHNWEFFSRC